MVLIAFILGLSLGIAFHFWRIRKLNLKLTQILTYYSKTPDLVSDLPPISLVRREILDLKQKCEEIHSELETWENILEKAPIGYLRVDSEDQLISCNQQARQLLNIDRWQPGQVRLLLELVRSYELDQLIQKTRNLNTPLVQQWQHYALSPSSEKARSLVLKASSYPLLSKEVAVFLENEQPLIELSNQSDRAFSDLTHELRTPLTSISLVAETLEKRLSNPEKKWVEQMLEEIKRLIQLIEDWLEISHLKKDPSKHLHYQSVELPELIYTSWQTLEPLAKQKHISLIYQGPDNIVIEADKSRLIQVFLNLFDNAIKHSPPELEIVVELELKNNSHIEINVIDSGAGFIGSDLPYVFNRLYRGEISRVRQSASSGSGLGLAIVQQIILAHGGQIQAKNHPLTGGAWLQFNLPINNPVKF